MNYGKIIASHTDPIEKKPLYHFYPGSHVFSISTLGCNFSCDHCQNPDISQNWRAISGVEKEPEEISQIALRNKAQGIAYTYTEPTIFFEYAYDCAKIAKKQKLFNIFVTNGYMSDECIKKMKGVINASNVDLKAFNEKFYNNICGGIELGGVLKSIKALHKIQHIELTTLLIPGLNDSKDEIIALSKWVKKLDKNIPLHFNAYFPANRMTIHLTSEETVIKAREIALEEGLNYVYTGNIKYSEGSNTFCPKCKNAVVKRFGNYTENYLKNEKCQECGNKINIITK